MFTSPAQSNLHLILYLLLLTLSYKNTGHYLVTSHAPSHSHISATHPLPRREQWRSKYTQRHTHLLLAKYRTCKHAYKMLTRQIIWLNGERATTIRMPCHTRINTISHRLFFVLWKAQNHLGNWKEVQRKRRKRKKYTSRWEKEIKIQLYPSIGEWAAHLRNIESKGQWKSRSDGCRRGKSKLQ